MKKIIGILIALVLLSGASAYAKPERLKVKNQEVKVKERAARAQINEIDLNNIEDPEARRAIREIFNYLNLSPKK